MQKYRILFDKIPETLLPVYQAFTLAEAGTDLASYDAIVGKVTSPILPVFPTVEALNARFLKPLKADIKGKPESTSVVWLILKFFDIGDPIDNATVRDIVAEIDPSLNYAAITNATARLQIVNGVFMGVNQVVLNNMFLRHNFPKFTEERN